MDATPRHGAASPPTLFEVGRTAAAEAVISVHGDLDAVSAPQLRGIILERLATQEPIRAIVDLSGCEFLDSAGIGVLVAAARLLGGSDASRFALRGVSGPPKRALDLVGLDRIIPILPDPDPRWGVTAPPRTAGVDSVVLVDGVFLLSDALRDAFDVGTHLIVSPSESLRRALVRDRDLFGSEAAVRERHTRRYLPAQAACTAGGPPGQVADIVVDNEDPLAPRILGPPSELRP